MNSEERDNKALFLVHKSMDKVNSDWISSTKSVDSSTQRANKAWKAQRGDVSNKALQGAEEERSDQERNMEMEGKQNENQETGSETEEEEQGYNVYSCSYLILSIVQFYEESQGGCNVKWRIHVTMFRCYSLENSVLVVRFMPERLKNPRKRGSITTKRVRSNYASKMDMGVVVSSDEGDCVIKTFKWITQSAMKAFVQSCEEKVTELAQEGVDFMRGIDGILRLSKCVQGIRIGAESSVFYNS